MNKQWLSLLKEESLHCHICGLLIYKEEHLTADHSPVPKTRGGVEKYPAHFWCNQAKAARSELIAAALLRLIKKWVRHGVKFPNQAEDSLAMLEAREQRILAESQNRR